MLQGLNDYLKWREKVCESQKDLDEDRSRLAFSKRAYARWLVIYCSQCSQSLNVGASHFTHCITVLNHWT